MRYIRRIIIGLLFVVPLVPLIVTPQLSYPFVTGKALVFRGLVDIAAILWAPVAFRYRPVLGRPGIVFLVLILVCGIADAQAVHPQLAFFSDTMRMDGYINLVHLFIFFLLAATFLGPFWRPWLGICAVVSVLVTAMAVAQSWFVALYGPFGIAKMFGAGQAWSFLGNPDFLGNYAALTLFLCAFLAARNRWWLVAVAANGVSVLLSQSRASLLAILFGGAVWVFWRCPRAIRRYITVSVVLVAVLAAWSPTLGHLPLMYRIERTSLNNPRVETWKTALRAIQERPLLGWGQENFTAAYDLAKGPQPHGWDRAHDLALDWLVSAGLIGLLTYSLLLWETWAGIGESFANGERAALYALLAAYVVNSAFTFDTLTSYLPLVTAIALTIRTQSSAESRCYPRWQSIRWRP